MPRAPRSWSSDYSIFSLMRRLQNSVRHMRMVRELLQSELKKLTRDGNGGEREGYGGHCQPFCF